MKPNSFLVGCFCGAKSGNTDTWLREIDNIGKYISNAGCGIVYGGGTVGLMGRLANAVTSNGGEVIGVLPKVLIHQETENNFSSSTIITEDMHERKRIIYEKSDIFLVLPGGIGTFDEMCETIAWLKIGIHDKELYILNIDGFFNPFINLLEHLNNHGFINEGDLSKVHIITSIEQLPLQVQEQNVLL